MCLITYFACRCVLNWFGDWSNEALYDVGKEFTSKLDLDRNNYRVPDYFPAAFTGMPTDPTHRQAITNAFVYVHQTLHHANDRLLKRGGRVTTITPRHYLDFINHYVKLFHEKCSELEDEQVHLNVGLSKIRETVEQVEELQKSLALKSNELEQKNQAANAKLKEMLKDQQEAEKKKVQSQDIQTQLKKQEAVIAEKRASVMQDLAQVEPAVKDAQQGKWRVHCVIGLAGCRLMCAFYLDGKHRRTARLISLLSLSFTLYFCYSEFTF